MNKTTRAAKAALYIKTLCYEWGAGLVGYIKRAREERKIKKQPEPAADRAARRTMWATIWIALFTSILAIVGYLQWSELDESSSQTDRMIRLYRSQVNQLSKQAGDTHDLAGQTRYLAGHMKDEAAAAQQFADTAGLINSGVADAVTKLQAQGEKMDAARKSSEEIERADNRAILAVPLVPSLIPLARDCPEFYPIPDTRCAKVYYKNFGATPAVQIHATAEYFVGYNPTAMPYDGSDLTDLPVNFFGGSVLIKDGQQPFIVSTRDRVVGTFQHGGYGVIGIIQYWDVFGYKHATGFCIHWNDLEPPAFCHTGNWFDKYPDANQKNDHKPN